jgi:hypothetical protein
LNLIVFSNGSTTQNKDIEKFLVEIEIEHLFNRIIRIAKKNNILAVYCIIDSNEVSLNNYILSHDLGIAVTVIVKTKLCQLHELFALSSSLKTGPFCTVTLNSIFGENDFSAFINYSLSLEDIEGVISITHLKDEEAPLCVALNEEDRIFKFSNATEGYNWIVKDICFFYPHFFDEVQYAIKTGITDLQNYLKLLISRGYQLNGFVFSGILEIKDIGFHNISDFSHN